MARVSASLLAAGVAAALSWSTAPAYAAAPPTAVTNLAATPGDSQVKLTWTNPADADFAGVTVVQKDGATAPTSIADGTTRYTGVAQTTTVLGLTNGSSYSFAVFTRNTDGDVSDPAVVVDEAPIPALATTLVATLTPGVVTHGQGVTITGTLKRTDNGEVLGGEPVDFYRKTAGQADFVKLGRLTTNAAGVVVYKPALPQSNTQWYLQHPAGAYVGSSKSATLTSNVRPRLSVRASAYTVEQGVASVIHVGVSPNHAGQSVLLQLWTSKGWETKASRTINASSVARFDIATNTLGKRVFRFAKNADADHVGTVTTAFGITVVKRTLRSGMSGADVLAAQKRLAALRYDVGAVNGFYGYDTLHAVAAFQKAQGLPRNGTVDPRTYERLMKPAPIVLRYSHRGAWVEADLTKQVLYYVRDGVIQRILDVSSGSGETFYVEGETQRAVTPLGNFSVLRKIGTWRISRLGSLWKPAYFAAGGFAIHGAPSVPFHPASHGCIRITIPAMNRIYDMLVVGMPVHVYR